MIEWIMIVKTDDSEAIFEVGDSYKIMGMDLELERISVGAGGIVLMLKKDHDFFKYQLFDVKEYIVPQDKTP